MESFKLSTIVLTVLPEMFSCLTPVELDSQIVFRDGMESLESLQVEDVLEMIEATILHHKSLNAWLH